MDPHVPIAQLPQSPLFCYSYFILPLMLLFKENSRHYTISPINISECISYI